ncbi:MAG: hypothetical protein ACP5M8_08120, partial [Caldisphaera sp.]
HVCSHGIRIYKDICRSDICINMDKKVKNNNILEDLDVLSEIVAYEIREHAKQFNKPIIKLELYDENEKKFEKKFKLHSL